MAAILGTTRTMASTQGTPTWHQLEAHSVGPRLLERKFCRTGELVEHMYYSSSVLQSSSFLRNLKPNGVSGISSLTALPDTS